MIGSRHHRGCVLRWISWLKRNVQGSIVDFGGIGWEEIEIEKMKASLYTFSERVLQRRRMEDHTSGGS